MIPGARVGAVLPELSLTYMPAVGQELDVAGPICAHRRLGRRSFDDAPATGWNDEPLEAKQSNQPAGGWNDEGPSESRTRFVVTPLSEESTGAAHPFERADA